MMPDNRLRILLALLILANVALGAAAYLWPQSLAGAVLPGIAGLR